MDVELKTKIVQRNRAYIFFRNIPLSTSFADNTKALRSGDGKQSDLRAAVTLPGAARNERNEGVVYIWSS